MADAYDRLLRLIRKQVHAFDTEEEKYIALAVVYETMKGISSGLSLALINLDAVQDFAECQDSDEDGECDPPQQPPPMDPPPNP